MAANLNSPDFHERDRDGFRVRRAYLGRDAGAERLGMSLWDVPPGEAAYPYHWHLADEELIVVLEGRPSLRTPEGWRELEQGEVVSFLIGEKGAHQLVNRTDESVRFLSISTNLPAEVCIYPDSNKIGAYDQVRDEIDELYFRSDSVDYWEREEPPGGG